MDLLINNAGITHRSAFKDTSPEVFAKVMAVNYLGSLHCTQAALPSLLQRRGQIAVISSVAGVAPSTAAAATRRPSTPCTGCSRLYGPSWPAPG